jgi:hypothetical protein
VKDTNTYWLLHQVGVTVGILSHHLLKVNAGCNPIGNNDYSKNRGYLVAKPIYIVYTLANIRLEPVTSGKSITNIHDVISLTIHSSMPIDYVEN